MNTKIMQLWCGNAKSVVFCALLTTLLAADCLASGPPPVITVQPLNQSVSKNGTAIFTVSATSGTKLSYQWNSQIGSYSIKIPGATNNSLVFNNAIALLSLVKYNVSVINAGGTVSSSTVTLTVTNNAPVANNDAYTTTVNVAITNGIPVASAAANSTSLFASLVKTAAAITAAQVNNPSSVLANDTDANGDPLTAILVTSVSNGTVNFYSNGTFNYYPNTNFIGNDSFSYMANDGTTNSGLATVTISVNANTNSYQPVTCTTLDASDLLTTAATLNALLNSQESAVNYYFQYGTTTNYGLATSPSSLPPGTNQVTVSAQINGLTQGTTYHYSVVANGAGGMSVGNDMTLTTPMFNTTSITIATNGFGGISPSINGASLIIGQIYTLSAIPGASGVIFTNWSDASGNLVSTNLTMSFTMASNLWFTASFLDVAKPTVTIASPLANSSVSNGFATIAGNAVDNVGVAAIFCNLNNSGWFVPATSNNLNNWSASLNLIIGTNTFSAYAVDTSGNVSATNSVRFNYTPVATLTVLTNGLGSFSPALNGSVVRIGQSCTLTATAGTGFTFKNWTSSGGVVSTNSLMTFLMASNLVYTANFVDTARPTVSVIAPVSNLSSTNEFLFAAGKSADNVAVSAVYCQLNKGNWYAASSTNQWTNWLATLDLLPGTNVLAVYAVDNSGNVSATLSAKVFYTTAFSSLNGLKAVFNPDTLNASEFAFGASTFSQYSNNTNNCNGVGSYTYTRLSPNTAKLVITYTAPPLATNLAIQNLFLGFGSPGNAWFTNLASGSTGSIMFSTLPPLAAKTLSGKNVFFIGSQGQATFINYTASKYVSTLIPNLITNIGTSYTYTIYSPISALLKQVDTNGLTYLVTSFGGTNFGAAYSESYSTNGVYAGSDTAFFGFASQSLGGNAPTNLFNRRLSFESGGGKFKLTMSANTFAQFSLSTNFDSGVGSYAYSLADTNTGNITLNYFLPTVLVGASNNARLQFFAPNLAFYTNLDGTFGASVLGNSLSLVPNSLSGAIISATNIVTGNLNQFSFASDNTFNLTGYLNDSGSFSFASYSSESGLAQLTFTGGDLAGDTGTLQLDYSGAAAGRYLLSIFDGDNNLLGTSRGVFGQQ